MAIEDNKNADGSGVLPLLPLCHSSICLWSFRGCWWSRVGCASGKMLNVAAELCHFLLLVDLLSSGACSVVGDWD